MQKALCIALLIIVSISALEVPITVKEPSGFAVSDWPVTVMVPMPKGAFTTTASFRLFDASNNPVPAQFNPILRYAFQDNSLRFVQVVFKATLSAKGSAKFYLRDAGTAVAPTNAVSVTENGSILTVNTGALKFTVKKSGFNLFNKVWLMPGDVLVADSNGQQGAFFKNDRGVQEFKDRTIDTFTIEESGPMRVVLRLESYGRSVDSTTNTPGFIFRIYAYAGSRFVKVDAGLVNGDRTTWGYPVYFKDFSLRTPLAVTSPTVRFGTSTVAKSRASGTGCRLIQWGAKTWRLQDGAGAAVDSAEEMLPGWFDVSDASKGLMLTERFFWQANPNGYSVDANGVISASPFPETKYYECNWRNWAMQKDTISYYVLDDMRGIRKEYLYYFHGASATNEELTQYNRNFQWPPVASVPYKWHRQCGTTVEFGGTLPDSSVVTMPAATSDTLTWSADNFDYTKDAFSMSWNNFRSDRRYVCGTGSWPSSMAGFLIDGAPGRFFQAEMWALGEMNLRGYWCPGWKESMNSTSAMGKVNYCSGEWRSTAAEYYMRKGGAYRPGTNSYSWGARDFEHLWVYNVEEFYNFSGDPWIRDCMLFWCEYFKSVQKNVMNDSSLGNMATRGSGHTFAAFLSAMRMTNGSEYLQYADKWVSTVHTRAAKTFPKYSVPIGEGPFQLQFLDRAIASYMQMVEGTHPLKWQKGFQTLWAHAEWNTYYANYCYYWADTTTAACLADTTPGGSGGSYADAMAAISLMAQHRPFVKNLKTAFPSKDMYFSRTAWDGNWMARPTVEWGRLYYNKANLDTTPPVKVNDLTGEGFYGGVKLRFALPATAKGYHVVWSYKPIKEGPDTISYRDTVKYFQAFPGGVFNTSKEAGVIESVTVELPVGDTTFYFAVKTLDSLNNISDLSNVFKIRHNVTVAESSDDVIASTPLLNAYPNPFNPVVKLTLTGVPNSSITTYKIFDVSGKVVADMTDAAKKSGMSQRRITLNWNASGYGSGIYVVRVTSNKGSIVKKLIYTK